MYKHQPLCIISCIYSTVVLGSPVITPFTHRRSFPAKGFYKSMYRGLGGIFHRQTLRIFMRCVHFLATSKQPALVDFKGKRPLWWIVSHNMSYPTSCWGGRCGTLWAGGLLYIRALPWVGACLCFGPLLTVLLCGTAL